MPAPRGPISNRFGPIRPAPLTTGEERVHNPEDDHGTAIMPARVIPPHAGWLVSPENVGVYTGDNAPWRK